MARVSRKDAGKGVENKVTLLSGSLIGNEDEAKASMEAIFLGAVANVAEQVREYTGTGSRTSPVMRKLSDALTASARNCVEATAGPYRVLAAAAIEKAMTSMRGELLICERTLGVKYKGLTSEAIGSVRSYAEDLAETSVDAYMGVSLLAVPYFRSDLVHEISVSTSKGEDAEVRVQRVCSPTPIKVVAHSGRGLWWKVLEQCNRAARETEFATLNEVRLQAMKAFNELGAER